MSEYAIRKALVRLLWREVADGGGCVCEEGAVEAGEEMTWHRELTDTCEAMRALGWGQHWDAKQFQKRAMRYEGRAEPRAAATEALSLEDAAGITDVIRGTAAQGEEK